MKRLMSMALVMLSAPLPVAAITIHVPADQPTIQAGMDAAANGDTVLVAPGTYTGDGNRDLLFPSKGLVVQSESGPRASIIDCEGSRRVPTEASTFPRVCPRTP